MEKDDNDNSSRLLSGSVMTAVDLADAVERAARGMNQTALQRATGLSARTLRDILAATPGRRFGRTTLDKLDEPLGWAPGTAWRLHRQSPQESVPDARTVQLIRAQMDAMVSRVAMLEEQPSWAGEVLDAFRLLQPEDRAMLLALARRLSQYG